MEREGEAETSGTDGNMRRRRRGSRGRRGSQERGAHVIVIEGLTVRGRGRDVEREKRCKLRVNQWGGNIDGYINTN